MREEKELFFSSMNDDKSPYHPQAQSKDKTNFSIFLSTICGKTLAIVMTQFAETSRSSAHIASGGWDLYAGKVTHYHPHAMRHMCVFITNKYAASQCEMCMFSLLCAF